MEYLSSICSLCLLPTQNLRNILSVDNDDIVVQHKLKVFLIELVNFKPYIHKYICNNCLEQVNNIYNFKLLCLKSITSLKDYLEQFDAQVSNKSKKMLKKDKKQIKTTIHEVNLTENHDQIKKPEQVFIKTEIDDSLLLYNENIQDNLSEDVFIKQENQSTNGNENLLLSAEINEESLISNIDDSNIQEPLENIHHEIDIKYEPVLSKNTDTKDIHLKALLKSSPANTITELTPTSSAAKDPTKPLKCNECHKTFSHRGTLTLHQRIHTGDPRYKCARCDVAFTNHKTFRSHIQNHPAEKPHRCKTCGKEFRQLSVLTKHNRLHTGEHPFACEVCEKTFKQKCLLQMHELSHTGRKTHKCEMCDKAFYSKHHLTRHKVIHTSDKPFECDICLKRYNDKSTLNKHKYTHVENETHACDLCNKTFYNKVYLMRHVRTHFNKNL